MSFTQVSISELQPTEPLSFDEWLDFAKRGQAKGKRDCTPGKSYPCKSICLTSSKNCRNPLEGQAKTYADWLKSGGEKVQATKVETSLAKKRREAKEERVKTPTKLEKRQLNRQEQLNDLLANLMTAANVDSLPELESWLESNEFSSGSFKDLGNVIRLTIDVGIRFKNRVERRYAYVKNAAVVLQEQARKAKANS